MTTVDPSGAIHDAKGRFAGHVASEAGMELSAADQAPASDAVDKNWRTERAEQLASMGYVRPAATPTNIPTTTTDRISDWWTNSFIDAEHGHAEGDYPVMPDDNTPGMHGGRSLAGNRRTHRMNYSGAGISLRMPSKTAIHRFAKERGARTFDVPLSVTASDGSTKHGTVRVVRGEGNVWNVKALGFSGSSEIEVSEGVKAILEGQRARTALAEAGDLTRQRVERMTKMGAAEKTVSSEWVKAVGLTTNDGGDPVMTMRTKPYERKDGTVTPGRSYGYKVDPETFKAMSSSGEPGRFFNRQIKGKATPVEVMECDKCHRLSARADHVCPTRSVTAAPRPKTQDAPRASWREAAAARMERFRRRD